MLRRDFLKTSSLATASLWVPKFLQGFSRHDALAPKGRILVMLQLSGGNDGLNTVVPLRNDVYYRERRGIAIAPTSTLSIGDEAGLHPALTALKSLHDAGELAVLHNVGYPNPDRSHFRSMDIWQSGSPADAYWQTGWLGRYLDAQCSGCARPTQALELDDTLGLVLKGNSVKGLALQDARRLYESAHSPYFQDYIAAQYHPAPIEIPEPRRRKPSAAGGIDLSIHEEEAPVDYLYKTMSETLASADYLFEKSRAKASTAVYPATKLGKHFQTIASLVLADCETSVYYVSHGSFDTHINQAGQQQRLFQEMNDALAAFSAELKAQGRWEEVLVVTFSEFGRRVAQNASGGTDHGTANQMFFMGGKLRRQGLLNGLPNLEDLDEGDLKYQVDFRQVYATLLENWLEADSAAVLGQRFTPMDFI